eukprot:7844955-Alexandrium_andersonii.AAC.1
MPPSLAEPGLLRPKRPRTGLAVQLALARPLLLHRPCMGAPCRSVSADPSCSPLLGRMAACESARLRGGGASRGPAGA